MLQTRSFQSAIWHSRQQFFNYLPARLAQLLETARVEASQLVVVQTEQVENRGVDVLERVRDFDGFLADFIRQPHFS